MGPRNPAARCGERALPDRPGSWEAAFPKKRNALCPGTGEFPTERTTTEGESHGFSVLRGGPFRGGTFGFRGAGSWEAAFPKKQNALCPGTVEFSISNCPLPIGGQIGNGKSAIGNWPVQGKSLCSTKHALGPGTGAGSERGLQSASALRASAGWGQFQRGSESRH